MNVSIEQSQSSSSSAEAGKSPSTKTLKKKAGRKIFKETRHPIYRGVRHKNPGKWVCEVREPKKKSRIWLGTYADPEAAAVAHDVAALALRGNSAVLNFPMSASLPRADSSSHQDIQMAAIRAARDFRPTSLDTTLLTYPSTSQSVGSENCSAATEMQYDENAKETSMNGSGFVDEEEMFNMPALLDSMAEGMLLTPLAMKKGFNWSQDEVDDEFALTLWDD